MMELRQNTHDAACCFGCGYLLRGLEQPVCPECGRKFDPADPTSFAATKRIRTWRRWRWRIAGAFVFVMLLIAAAPRGTQYGTLTFTCSNCKESITIKRWQLLPPKWIPRFPGYTWREKVAGIVSINPGATCPHNYSVSFNFKGGYVAAAGNITMSAGGGASLYGSGAVNSLGVSNTNVITINGQTVTPKTAEPDLEKLLNPMIAGVGP